MVYKCYTPGDLDDARGATRSAIGDVVEWYVKKYYCAEVRNPCHEFDPRRNAGTPQTDFFDAFMGPSRCNNLAEFLQLHYGVDATKLGAACMAKKDGDPKKRFPVPDIITYVEDGWGEYYEIKPNSVAGRRDGRDKIKWFNESPAPKPGEPPTPTGIVKEFGLRQHPGTTFTSDHVKKLLVDGRYGAAPYKVWLEFWRESPGLILYQFCLEIDMEEVAELFVLLIFAAIAALLWEGLAVGAAATALAVADSTSPLRGTVGTGGENAIADLWYVQSLYSAYHWHTTGDGDTGFEFLECQPPGEDTAGGCVPDTTAIIESFSPDGQFTPTDPGFRKLEVDFVASAAERLTAEAAALLGHPVGEITDEEGDGPAEPLSTAQIALATVQGYLDAGFRFSQLPLSQGPGNPPVPPSPPPSA
jgi:hypothetical protein